MHLLNKPVTRITLASSSNFADRIKTVSFDASLRISDLCIPLIVWYAIQGSPTILNDNIRRFS